MSFLTRDGVINDAHEFQRRQTSKPVMCGEVVMKNKVLMDTFVDILYINGGKGEDISNAPIQETRRNGYRFQQGYPIRLLLATASSFTWWRGEGWL